MMFTAQYSHRTRTSAVLDSRQGTSLLLSDGVTALSCEFVRNDFEVVLPDIFGGRRQDLCPHRQAEAEHLRITQRPRVEPQVEVRRAVTPSTHVNSSDTADGLDRAIESNDELSQFRG